MSVGRFSLLLPVCHPQAVPNPTWFRWGGVQCGGGLCWLHNSGCGNTISGALWDVTVLRILVHYFGGELDLSLILGLSGSQGPLLGP
ncbi:hypothetical protein RRG08_066710 [Elysia crispata]|uniref:Uncharacterized protein n=1 Tax=Elysia crispata TaxID=231223 RepID=A0AAE1B909_9GAST|nr:hypothetical protein RRG08_066710 [Elysia crispata]